MIINTVSVNVCVLEEGLKIGAVQRVMDASRRHTVSESCSRAFCTADFFVKEIFK